MSESPKRNKYPESIVTADMDECFICGTRRDLEVHHVFFGTGNRALSTKYGCVVGLCPSCHRGDKGVHNNRERDLALKRTTQRKFEQKYSHELFMQEFGRNYL